MLKAVIPAAGLGTGRSQAEARPSLTRQALGVTMSHP
jgi:hypothetical protein